MKRLFLTLSGFFSLFPGLARACEGCKEAASSGIVEPQTVLAGFALSWSVLFMLGCVLSLLAGLSWLIRTTCLKADAAHRIHSQDDGH